MNVPFQVRWKNLHFVMWDIGGQESLRQAWSTYYSSTHFLIVVIDSTDRERLNVTKEELYKMLGHEVCLSLYNTNHNLPQWLKSVYLHNDV